MIFQGTTIQIQLTSTDSLTGATTANILYVKPNGSFGMWSGTITGNVISYTTAIGDLDVVGDWQLQGEVFKGTARLLTSQVVMTVGKGI
jgi:hypothetical protein